MELLSSLVISLTSLLLLLLVNYSSAYDLIFAVNCGGNKHTDRYGIKYASDSNPTGIGSSFGQSLLISRVHPDDVALYQTERYHTSTFGYSTRLRGDGEYLLILKFTEVYFTGPGQKVAQSTSLSMSLLLYPCCGSAGWNCMLLPPFPLSPSPLPPSHFLALEIKLLYRSPPSLSLFLLLFAQVFDVVLNGVPVIQDLDIFARVGKAVAYDEVVSFTVERDQLSVRDSTVDFDGSLSIQFAKVS